MFYTPRKTNMEQSPRNISTSPKQTETAGPSTQSTNGTSQVRRSIGEWETGLPGKRQSTSPNKAALNPTPPLGPKQKAESSEQAKPTDRVTQARAWLRKAKTHLSESRNLKTDLKAGITLALDEMYKLVKEEATERKKGSIVKKDGTYIKDKSEKGTMTEGKEASTEGKEMIKMLEWQKQKIEETHLEMRKLREAITTLHSTPQMTYAEKTAEPAILKNKREPPLHSIVIAPKDANDTGEQVLERVRKAMNAKDGWITVEKVRKVKDRKVIVGCRTKEEREKVKERLKSVEDHLHVEEVKNQDPMLVLRDVLTINSNEDILMALRNQNGGIFHGLDKKDDRVEIRYRRRGRNPHIEHVVIRVSPRLYNKMLESEKVHIDMQKVRVADQSPLVQCSMCLGYGHGRRFCKETEPKCSHCGGLHLKQKCPVWIAGLSPCCTNCTNTKSEHTEHNAFSEQCPVRRRWEALARAKIAYC